MKRLIITLLLITILSSVILTSAIPAFAQDDDFSFQEIGAGKLRITDSDKSMTQVVIPSEYNGSRVTEIYDSAFQYNSRAVSVVIPQGIEVIYAYAFEGMSSIENVVLPDSLYVLDNAAFASCTALTDVTIPSGVKHIGSNVFEDCSTSLVVHCYKGSTAESWCEDNGIEYDLLDATCSHTNLIYNIQLDPSECVAEGRICNKCNDCGACLQIHSTSAEGHSYGKWILKDNTRTRICSKCGFTSNGFTSVSEKKIPFADINTDSWYIKAVEYMRINNLMNGISEYSFKPQGVLNRAMLVTILAQMYGADTANCDGTIFCDVEGGSWYDKNVGWAADNRIVSGYGDGYFGPLNPVTREQLAVILKAYTEFTGREALASNSDVLETFIDYELVSGWAVNALTWAVNEELIAGDANGYILPRDSATRAQVSQIVYKFIKFSGEYQNAYDRAIYIHVSGASSHFNDTRTTNIDNMSLNIKNIEPYNGSDDYFNTWASVLHGVSSDIHGVNTDTMQYHTFTDKTAYPSVYALTALNYPGASFASFCNKGELNQALIEESVGADVYTNGSDFDLTDSLLQYLDSHDPKILTVQYNNCFSGGEHFDGGFGGQQYLQQIELTDGLIGSIVDKYKQLDRYDNTLIVITTDNKGETANSVYYATNANTNNIEKTTDAYKEILGSFGISFYTGD